MQATTATMLGFVGVALIIGATVAVPVVIDNLAWRTVALGCVKAGGDWARTPVFPRSDYWRSPSEWSCSHGNGEWSCSHGNEGGKNE